MLLCDALLEVRTGVVVLVDTVTPVAVKFHSCCSLSYFTNSIQCFSYECVPVHGCRWEVCLTPATRSWSSGFVEG